MVSNRPSKSKIDHTNVSIKYTKKSDKSTVKIETINSELSFDDVRPKWRARYNILIIFSLIITFVLIGGISVGLLYKHDCPIESWIPQWLWIFSAAGLVTIGFQYCIVN